MEIRGDTNPALFPEKENCWISAAGPGGHLPLTQMGYEVAGIDISASMLKAAILESERLNLKINFQEMDAKTLTFADHSFDCAIYSFNGLDHIPAYAGKVRCYGKSSAC